jgi:outer membrane receptor protein involved in Fe transport
VFNDPANGIQGLPLGYTTGRPTGFAFSNFPNVIGSLHTKEVFGEVQVPILSNVPFADSLNFSGAIRWAGYSGSGTSWSWKYGLDWAANSSIRLRGTMSRDVRAATLSERFDRTANAVGVEDPEFGGVSVAVGTTTGGNPNVAPEKADTVTFGAVFTPSFMSGFNMSVDWYDIKIKGAIGQLGAQRIVDDCFNGAANVCAQITRDPISNQLLQIDDVYQNVNQARVSGVDVEMSYTSGITFLGGGDEILNMRLFGTWLDENSTTNIGAPKLDRAGETGSADLPEIKLSANIAYSTGPLEIFIQERYIDSGLLRANYVEGVDIDNNHVKSAYYTDLNLTYTIETEGGSTWELFGNVTNLLDKSPPVTANWSGFGGATQTNGSLFDILGRRFTMGFRLRM